MSTIRLRTIIHYTFNIHLYDKIAHKVRGTEGVVAKYVTNKINYITEMLAHMIFLQTNVHPNVLPYLDLACYGSGFVFFTERCDGVLETINSRIIYQLIDGLQYLHNFLVHCDIKSDNIFMKQSIPKIADFGHAYVYGQILYEYPSYVYNSVHIEEGGTPTPNCDLEGIIFLILENLYTINSPVERKRYIKYIKKYLPNKYYPLAREIIKFKSQNHEKLKRIIKH